MYHGSQSGQCQLCWQGGEVICCDFCPAVMHPHCAGIEDIDGLGSTWACPHHKCSTMALSCNSNIKSTPITWGSSIKATTMKEVIA